MERACSPLKVKVKNDAVLLRTEQWMPSSLWCVSCVLTLLWLQNGSDSEKSKVLLSYCMCVRVYAWKLQYIDVFDGHSLIHSLHQGCVRFWSLRTSSDTLSRHVTPCIKGRLSFKTTQAFWLWWYAFETVSIVCRYSLLCTVYIKSYGTLGNVSRWTLK